MIEYKGGDFRNYLVRKSITFDHIEVNGFSFSIQANEFTYCSPRINSNSGLSYSTFELGFCGQLYNQCHNSVLDEYYDGDDIAAYVPVESIQKMIDWYYHMISKKQYLEYVCELETDNKIADPAIRIREKFNDYTLEDICRDYISVNNENKYREHLHDYLNVKFCDLPDEVSSSTAYSVDDILARL